MTDERLGPEILSTRGVPSTRRGYDKRVIDGLLSEAARHWQSLAEEHDELQTAVDEAGGLEILVREMGEVARDVGEILEAAKEAADGLRRRAREDAERLERETGAEIERLLTEADEQAFELRRDAWDSGTLAIDSAMDEADAIIEAGEQDVLRIRAHAEQESHRRVSAARKEADDIIRTARFEADRLLNQAREVAQQIIDKAWEDEGEHEPVASGPVSPERRRELLEEIERLRSQRSIEAVEVFDTDPPPPDRSPQPVVDREPEGIDLSDELAAEVEQLRGSGSPEVVKISTSEPMQFGTEDDVGTLFEALRTTGEVEPVGGASEPDDEEDLSADPFELRDQLIIPVVNDGTREAKRRIVDLQNIALDGLRGSGWTPDTSQIATELRSAIEPMIFTAASAGATAAGPLAGVAGAMSEPGRRAPGLAGEMAESLAGQLAAVLESGGGPEMEAAAVSRVFREWRTDGAERWSRRIALAAYHDSLLAAMRDGGVEQVVGVATGSACDECPGRDGSPWTPGGAPPAGTAVPPAHMDCSCSIRPALR
jgi:cell division septum initiation protein DivIVA